MRFLWLAFVATRFVGIWADFELCWPWYLSFCVQFVCGFYNLSGPKYPRKIFWCLDVQKLNNFEQLGCSKRFKNDSQLEQLKVQLEQLSTSLKVQVEYLRSINSWNEKIFILLNFVNIKIEHLQIYKFKHLFCTF
jgi:hypothetical protein